MFTKILENDTNKEPFKGETLQPVDNNVGRAVAHVGNSRQKFARPRRTVEAKLNSFLIKTDIQGLVVGVNNSPDTRCHDSFDSNKEASLQSKIKTRP